MQFPWRLVETKLRPSAMCSSSQLKIIRITQGWEPDTEVIVIGSSERILTHHTGNVEVVIEQNNVADGIVRIETASSIGHDHGENTEKLAHARCEGASFHGVAFVKMGTADE